MFGKSQNSTEVLKAKKKKDEKKVKKKDESKKNLITKRYLLNDKSCYSGELFWPEFIINWSCSYSIWKTSG